MELLRLRVRGSLAANAIEDREAGYGAAGEQASSHAKGQGQVVFVEAVNDGDHLQDAESREGDERDALVGFLAPDGDDLRDKEHRITEQAEAENDSYEFFHWSLLLLSDYGPAVDGADGRKACAISPGEQFRPTIDARASHTPWMGSLAHFELA
jgi:hypothetical protein